MNKFLKQFFVFAALLPFIWIAFVCAMGIFVKETYRKNLVYTHSGDGFLNTRMQQADSLKGVDVLIIGSSHAYRGFDTRIFKAHGIKAFNFGSSSQTPVQSKYLMLNYIDKLKPKLVLMEVGFMSLSSDGVESAIDIVSNASNVDTDLISMMATVNNISVYNTFILSYFNKHVGSKEQSKKERLSRKGAVFVEGGFVETDQIEYDDNSYFVKHSVAVNPAQKKAFDEIIRYLNEKHIPVVLVQAPVLYDNFTSVTNQSVYDSIFRSYSPVQYYNFNDSSYSSRFFYDNHHMNQPGVVRFNERLLEQLKPVFTEAGIK